MQSPPNPSAQPNYMPPTGPTIRFDHIGNAFSMVFADLATWITGSLLAFLPLILVGAVMGYLTLVLLVISGPVGLALGMLIRGLVVGPVMFVFLANMCRMAISALKGVKPSVNDVFKFEPNVTNTGLIVGLSVGVGSGLCLIPGLVAGGLMMLALPIAVDRKLQAKDAIDMSVKLMQKDIAMATIFFLCLSFCAFIGSVACVIGIIVTLGVLPLAVTMVYRDYVGFATEPSDAIPTPTAAPAQVEAVPQPSSADTPTTAEPVEPVEPAPEDAPGEEPK